MKASDLFVKCLEEEQVEYIFGLPGEETNDLVISLSDSPFANAIVLNKIKPLSSDMLFKISTMDINFS